MKAQQSVVGVDITFAAEGFKDTPPQRFYLSSTGGGLGERSPRVTV